MTKLKNPCSGSQTMSIMVWPASKELPNGAGICQECGFGVEFLGRSTARTVRKNKYKHLPLEAFLGYGITKVHADERVGNPNYA